MDDFDNITCEEFYGEDEQRRAWMDEQEREFAAILDEAANFQLQVIADELKESQVLVEMDAFYFGA